MTKCAWTQAKSDAEARKWPTGYVMNVPKDNLTDGKQELGASIMAQAVHAAVAVKLASAIHCNPCILKWLLSGTTSTTQGRQVTIQPNHMSRCGGSAVSGALFKLRFVIAPGEGFPKRLEANTFCHQVHYPSNCWLRPCIQSSFTVVLVPLDPITTATKGRLLACFTYTLPWSKQDATRVLCSLPL